jgi:hypothetical protein
MKILACLFLLVAPCAFAQEYDLSLTMTGAAGYAGGDYNTPTTFSGIVAYQNGQLAVNVSDPTLWGTPFTVGMIGAPGSDNGNGLTNISLYAFQGPSEFMVLSFSLSAPFGSPGPLTFAPDSVTFGNGWDQPVWCGGNPVLPPQAQGYVPTCSGSLTAVQAPELSPSAAMATLLGVMLLVAVAKRR